MSSDDSSKAETSGEILYSWNKEKMEFKATTKQLNGSQLPKRAICNEQGQAMSSLRRAAPLPTSSSLMMSDDDFSEIEIGHDGTRVYKHRPSRSHTSSIYRGHLGSNSIYGSTSMYGGSQSVHGGYSRSQFDTHSVRTHRDFSPVSFQSMRSVLSDPRTLMTCLREALEVGNLTFEEVRNMLLQVRVRAEKRKRYRREFQRGSDGSSEEDHRDSNRSELPIRYLKRARHMAQHPYTSSRSFSEREGVRAHRTFSKSRIPEFDQPLGGTRQLLQYNDPGIQTFTTQRSVSNMPLLPQSLRPAMQEVDIRNLTCTGVTEDVGHCDETVAETSKIIAISCNNTESVITQKDHIFLKPNILAGPKKVAPVPLVPPPPKGNQPDSISSVSIPAKTINQSKRLSDVSEIPEITQDFSNDSMRPSFIKRKLFTQTLDVAMEKDDKNDDSLPLNSPVPSIYSSVPRPKHKPVKSINPRPLLKRNIFEKTAQEDTGSIRNLIEQLVPHEKMNATTGILQKNAARSSIHEPKSVTMNNKENLNANSNLPSERTSELERVNEPDYDSDIFGPPLRSVEVTTKLNNDKEQGETADATESLPVNTLLQKEITKGKLQNVANKPNNKVATAQNTKKIISKGNSDNVKKTNNKDVLAKKVNDKNKSTDNIAKKANKQVDDPENIVKKANKQVALTVKEPNIIPQREETSDDETTLETSQGYKQKKTFEQLRNSICSFVSKPCSDVINKLTHSFKDKKVAVDNTKITTRVAKEPRAVLDNNKGVEGSKSKHTNINKVHNDLNLDKPERTNVYKNNKEMRGNKRSASAQPNKPSKVMMIQNADNKRSKSASVSKQKINTEEQHGTSDSEDDHEISFREDVRSNLRHLLDSDTCTPNTSTELGVRRSARKSVRPVRFIDCEHSTRNTSKESINKKTPGKRNSDSSTHKDKNEGTKRANVQKRQRSVSPTYTVSEGDANSPKKLAINQRVTKCKEVSCNELRRSPRINVNSVRRNGEKKSVSPAYKVTKHKISFGSKAKSPNTSALQRYRKAEPGKVQSQKRTMTKATDSFLEDSSDDFTPESLQRSRCFSGKHSAKKLKTPATSKTPVRNNRPTVAETTTLDPFLQDSSDDEPLSRARSNVIVQPKVTTSTNIERTNTTTLAERSSCEALEQKDTGKVNAPSKPNDGPTTFKLPLAVPKAPVQKMAQRNANFENSVQKTTEPRNNSSRSVLQSSVRGHPNKSKLPTKIRELLGTDWEEDELSEVDNSGGSIRQHVDQLNKMKNTCTSIPPKRGRRRRVAISPARSHISTRSEVACPSASLRNRAAKTFNSSQRHLNSSQDVSEARDATERRIDPGRNRYALGRSTVTIGVIPSFCRTMDSTRNTTRFDDNASVISACSAASFSSLRYGNKSTLHF